MGHSTEHKESIIKDKSCPEGTIFNKEDNVCVATNSFQCLTEGFSYDPLLGECVKIPSCDGMIDSTTGNCLLKKEISCAEGYEYNAAVQKCEKNPFCDKGTFNSINHLCEESAGQTGCPSGFTFNPVTNRCEKPLVTQIRKNCEEGFTYNSELKKCTLTTVDFSDWTVYGSDSDWQKNGTYVKQMINGNNTFLISPYTLGTSIVLEGKFKVDNDGDDDWAGLVFGWNGTTDLYIFDWKKANQGSAKKGFRLMKLSDYQANLWSSESTSGMTLLKSNFGASGWSYGVTYTMRVEYTFGRIRAYIDGNLVLEYRDPNLVINGGKVGFFNLSQSKVSYSDFYIESDPTCDPGYKYSIPYDICYIDEPNAEEDLETNIAWLYPSCSNGSFNTTTLKCEYTPTCANGGTMNNSRNKCQLNPTKVCGAGTTETTTSYPGYEEACLKTDLCPSGTYSQYFIDAGREMCVSGKLASCKKGEKLNEEKGRCEAPAYCEEGYKETENGQCEKKYTWYSYYCDAGWEGPAKPGKDCKGYCGGYDCKCNAENPLPNNCRKPLSSFFEREVLKERPMILHKVTGSLAEEEFGQIKGYQCGKDCLYIVDKIVGSGNQLCFHKKSGQESCFTVENCSFFGKIENELGLKEIQVGKEKKNNLKTCPPDYVMDEENDRCIKDFEEIDCSDSNARSWKVETQPTLSKHFTVDEFSHSGTLKYGIVFASHDLDLHGIAYDSSGNRLWEIYYNHKSEHNGALDHDMTSGGDETITIDVNSWKQAGARYVDFYVYSYSGGSLNSYNATCWYIDSYEKKREFPLVGTGTSLTLMRFDLETYKMSNIDSHVSLPDMDIYYCPEGTYRNDGISDDTVPGTCAIDICYKYDQYASSVDLDSGIHIANTICDQYCQDAMRNIQAGYQYVLSEGGIFSRPKVADSSQISCYDNSTTYNPATKQCEMSGNLDLRTWTIKGADADWSFNADGSVGTQYINTAQPTLLLHPDSFGEVVNLSGQIMTTDNDDDWIGLVFGSNSSGTEYFRFTWHTTGGGNSDSGFDISKYENGTLTTLATNIVSGSGNGYARNTWYTFGLKYMPGLIIGYVNGNEVLRYEDPDLTIKGRAGFYGYSQANVSYKNFSLNTSPKCPAGYSYDSTNKSCIMTVESDPDNVIHSTCKMNGHVGFFNNKTGIVSGVVESTLSEEHKNLIKDKTMNTFDLNATKYNKEERISFWDPYEEYYLGFLEFVNDVKDEDREDGFAPVQKLPYALGEDGFTAISTNNGKTYYVSVGSIGYSLTNADCDHYANKYKLERVTSVSGQEEVITRILSGGRNKENQKVDPICTDGIFNSETGNCDNAIDPNPVQFCLNGELKTRQVVETADLKGTIVIESTPNKGFDYSESVSGTPNFSNFGSTWKSEGFSLARTAIKLSDGNWYVKASMQPGDSRACGWPSSFKTLPDSNYRVISYSNTCYAGNSNISNACATKLEITLPAGLSLKGISDIESVAANEFGTAACNADNAYDEEYTIYEKDNPDKKIVVQRSGVGVQGSSTIDLSFTKNIGECIIYPRCILKDPALSEEQHIFNTMDKAVKVEKTNGGFAYKCSAYKCLNGQCKTETCPEGYSGSKIPSGVEVGPNDCTDNICDGNKEYVPYCGKDSGCPEGPGFLPAKNNHGPCYEYYCENGGTFDPETKKCKEFKCPPNTYEVADGTCRRK